MITLGALVPHPPIIVPGVGRPEDLAKINETTKAMKELDRLWGDNPPETIVIFTPHGTVFRDAIVIYGYPVLSGSLSQFGLAQTWEWKTDQELAEAIVDQGTQANLPVYLVDQQFATQYKIQKELDHGVLVPLSFFNPEWANQVRLVVIPLSYLPIEELYQFGSLVAKAAAKLNRKVAIIASGDLSHCLQPGAPAQYDPRGAEFDQKIVTLLQEERVKEFFNFDPVLLEKAAECGFRSIIMLLGTMDGKQLQTEVYSYQGPFGVGYAVASLKPMEDTKSILKELFLDRENSINDRRDHESPLVKYARSVVEAHVNGSTFPSVKKPLDLPDLESFMKEQAGTFVSIKKHGQLRGCIGTTEPTQASVIEEVTQNAISASSRDPRFNPIEPEELTDLVYSVDVLKPVEPISGIEELDPERYGVIVNKGSRRGLLLPHLEGIETATQQVAIAKQKAGISVNEEVELERFEVIRYH